MKAKDRRPATRTCALTRRSGEPDTLVRFVLSPDGVVTPDVKRRLPGRGVWIDATRASVEEAVRRKVFARAFRQAAMAPDGLAERVEALLLVSALERLSMAAKAGLVVAGFEKVRAALVKGPVAGLVIASDAALDGRTKLQALAKKAANLHKRGRLVGMFSSRALEGALGRERVIHVALAPGRPSELFFTDAWRWHGYATGERPDATMGEPDELKFAGPLTV